MKLISNVLFFLLLGMPAFAQNREDSLRWKRLEEQEIAQGKDSVYQRLLRMKSPDHFFSSRGLGYYTRPYFTAASKELLVELLKNDWLTQEQKRTIAKKQVWQQIESTIKTSTEVARDTLTYRGFSKERRAGFKKRADSLQRLKNLNTDTIPAFQQAITRVLESIETRQVANELVYTAGMLDDERYIPVLKRALNDTVHFAQQAVKMALARYGIAPYSKDMLAVHRIKPEILKKGKSDSEARLYEYNEAGPSLLYLLSQESIKEYSKLLRLEHFKRIDADDYSLYSVPNNVLVGLNWVILNEDIQSYLASINLPDNVKKEHIQWVIKWLDKNYGKYKLNRDYYPGLR